MQNKKLKDNTTTIPELKKFWDGPLAGFNEELYKEYLKKKELWRIKIN